MGFEPLRFPQNEKEGTPAKTLETHHRECSNRLRQRTRKKAGRNPEPSAGIIDSQSVKTTDVAGVRGYDGGKKINGRKRHIFVDVLGLIISVSVTAANIQDREAIKGIFLKIQKPMPRIKKIWADGGYTGPLIEWVLKKFGFNIRPWRWIVERTFGLLSYPKIMNA